MKNDILIDHIIDLVIELKKINTVLVNIMNIQENMQVLSQYNNVLLANSLIPIQERNIDQIREVANQIKNVSR
jgi:hypothetical protein